MIKTKTVTMWILNKWIYFNILLLNHLINCDSHNEAIQHLNLKFNRLNRITNGLQRDVEDIWTAISNNLARNTGKLDQKNNETKPENADSDEVLELVNGTVTEVKELKSEVEELIVYTLNGFKNEKAFSRKILNEIYSSQKEHEGKTTNDIEKMKVWLQNLHEKQRQILEDEFHNFTTNTNMEDKILLETTKTMTNKCEAKLVDNELEIQTLRDEIETVKQDFKDSMESYVTEAVALSEQKIFEKLREILTCDYPWEMLGNSCYFLSSEKMTWNDAREYCNSKGSHLVEIDNSDERDFLVQKYKAIFTVWVGGHDNENEGTYVWQTSNNTISGDYFYPGEPNGGRGENCAELYCHSARVGRLNDGNCGGKKNFVCEKSKFRF